MSLFLRIAYAFFKVGLLTVGGGLAMLPIIQHEMESRGWLTHSQFLDVVGIAEMTPGALAVNTATYVGYRVVGEAYPGAFGLAVAGALVGTVSVCLPSLLCVNLLGRFWERNRAHPCMVRVFGVLRPLVTGLVLSVALALAAHCLWGAAGPAARPDLRAGLLLGAAFALTAFTRVSPVWVLLGGGAAGVLLGAGAAG